MNEEIYLRGFISDWWKTDDRRMAKSFAQAVFRYMGNMPYEERVKVINEKHVKGTTFTLDELWVKPI